MLNLSKTQLAHLIQTASRENWRAQPASINSELKHRVKKYHVFLLVVAFNVSRIHSPPSRGLSHHGISLDFTRGLLTRNLLYHHGFGS